jgi:hypothetical protein
LKELQAEVQATAAKKQRKEKAKGPRAQVQLFGAQKVARKGRKKKQPAQKNSTASAMQDDDAAYLFCSGLFSESVDGEDWVQCSQCKKWAHEALQYV